MPPTKSKKAKGNPLKAAVKGLFQKAIDAFTQRKSEQAKEPKAELKAPKKPYRVVELFAGVGGFRVGLEKVLKGKAFQVVWSNQYEPGSAKQWASRVYEYQFPDTKYSKHSNKLIEEAIAAGEVPEHDVLVGGFPCQDYSVAKPNNQSRGIEGKKGVLWWSIYEIAKRHEPEFLILENVDRLVKSPAKQRGRDFAIMLKCLADLGYVVEWRVINAAEYGMPQRRRRVFIVGYKAKEKLGTLRTEQSPENILLNDGVLARAFPVQTFKPSAPLEDENEETGEEVEEQQQMELFQEASWAPARTIIEGDPHEITENFNKGNAKHDPFLNAGLMIPGKGGKPSVWTAKVYPKHKGTRINLGDLLTPDDKVPDEFIIDSQSLKSWVYHKGNKTEVRTNYLTTFAAIQKLFENVGVQAKLSNTQKRAWGKVLAAYWEENPTQGKPINLADEVTGKEVAVTWQLISETRFDYEFKEGPLPMPDPLDRPFRTIITSEGGSSPSRFKHVICRECAKNWAKKGKPLNHDCVKAGKFRRLTPEELEQGNMFPVNHTRYCKLDNIKTEVDAKHRAFFMGNALVTGIIESIGCAIAGEPTQSFKKKRNEIKDASSVNEDGDSEADFHFKRPEFDASSPESVIKWAKWLKGKKLHQSYNLLSPANKVIASSEIGKVAAKIRRKISDQSLKHFKGDKGTLGQLIELVHFGLKRNNRNDYDISESKIELKTTGLELEKETGAWTAKERLVLSQVNYQELVACEGTESDFENLELLRNIVIITFKYKKEPPFIFENELQVTLENLLSLTIHDVFLWTPCAEQTKVAFHDWKIIKAMCEAGYAHMISERYSTIIGAGPRGQGGKKEGQEADDFSKQVVEEAQGEYSLRSKAKRLGIQEAKLQSIIDDIAVRAANPGKKRVGYSIPQKGHDVNRLGKYPCQKRAYSISEKNFKGILKRLMTNAKLS